MKAKCDDLGRYIGTVLAMMKERHPDYRFTIMGSFEDPTQLDEDGDPTLTVALVSSEIDLEVIINRLVQVQMRIEKRREAEGDRPDENLGGQEGA